jgi:hypothetical protein
VSELNYEPRVIEAHAVRLNQRADSMGVTSAIIGAVIGGFFGAVPLTSLGDSWPIPSQFGFGTLLAGVLIGALTGYVIGDARAFGYRLQAQSSLCQLNLERNTAALLAGQYPGALVQRSEPLEAPAFEHEELPPEPAPEPAPLTEVRMPEYFEPEPEPAPFIETHLSAYLQPAPEPAPVTEALVPLHVEPEPEPVTLAEAPPAPAHLGEAPPPDLDSMSLEQIAELAKTGMI